MTTFEMAQKAFENPGKVFVGKYEPGNQTVRVYWSGFALRCGGKDDLSADTLYHLHAAGVQWRPTGGYWKPEGRLPNRVEVIGIARFVQDSPDEQVTAKWDGNGCNFADQLLSHIEGNTPLPLANTRWRVKVTAEEVL